MTVASSGPAQNIDPQQYTFKPKPLPVQIQQARVGEVVSRILAVLGGIAILFFAPQFWYLLFGVIILWAVGKVDLPAERTARQQALNQSQQQWNRAAQF